MEFKATNLTELLAELSAMTQEQIEAQNGDYSSLPVFGDYDGDTSEIFSWDNDSFLIPDFAGGDSWIIVDRGDKEENEN